MSAFDQSQRASLYTDEFAATVDQSFTGRVIAEPWREASGQDVLDVMLEVDVTTYLPGDLITKIDIATMAYALEARSPLLDHELMEFAASIPAELKVDGREKKWIFREALREWLPNEILDRPKQGFTVPIGDWFRGELRDLVREVLLDRDSLGRGYFRREAGPVDARSPLRGRRRGDQTAVVAVHVRALAPGVRRRPTTPMTLEAVA